MIYPLLVGDGQRRVKPTGPLAGFLSKPRVGSDHHKIAESLRLDGIAKHRHGVQVIDGNLEEALHLRCVKIERDHSVHASGFDGVRADTSPNGYLGSSFLSPLA